MDATDAGMLLVHLTGKGEELGDEYSVPITIKRETIVTPGIAQRRWSILARLYAVYSAEASACGT